MARQLRHENGEKREREAGLSPPKSMSGSIESARSKCHLGWHCRPRACSLPLQLGFEHRGDQQLPMMFSVVVTRRQAVGVAGGLASSRAGRPLGRAAVGGVLAQCSCRGEAGGVELDVATCWVCAESLIHRICEVIPCSGAPAAVARQHPRRQRYTSAHSAAPGEPRFASMIDKAGAPHRSRGGRTLRLAGVPGRCQDGILLQHLLPPDLPCGAQPACRAHLLHLSVRHLRSHDHRMARYTEGTTLCRGHHDRAACTSCAPPSPTNHPRARARPPPESALTRARPGMDARGLPRRLPAE